MHHTHLIGIDEAGRGPLAGPVTVGVVVVNADFDWNLLPGVNDSKKLSETQREAIYTAACLLQKDGLIDWEVGSVSAHIIDRIGIVPAVNRAMKSALTEIMHTGGYAFESCMVKLDGSLHAPQEFIYQETIIKGDAKEKVIGLASILAKVTRDRYMKKLAGKPQYQVYTFDVHKGYGTKKHTKAIHTHGVSDVHRLSFCRKLPKV
jgi:ribonuclease HII